MATISLAVKFVTYFNGVMHFQIADAANMVTNYMGVSYILSIVAAVLADTLFGRHRTAVIHQDVSRTVTACFSSSLCQARATTVQHPRSTCSLRESRRRQCSASLCCTIQATTMPSHGADQFDEKDSKELIQMSSYFNFVLLAVCLGAAVSLTVFVWIQDNK
ncbi:hypothetical protein NC653_010774 [Populus alba x Populus x berolinensis]|uniref:Nitrate transporter n=1 Tax=Populus alba x Populus x berolinensis TaxID=444605 RepID=A0AAD6R0M2_9ROSI|nr:hypothetical protein NC653_010774 [Populus alba x Populus x berolinensis]